MPPASAPAIGEIRVILTGRGSPSPFPFPGRGSCGSNVSSLMAGSRSGLVSKVMGDGLKRRGSDGARAALLRIQVLLIERLTKVSLTIACEDAKRMICP